MCPSQPRLFAEHNPQVEGGHNRKRIGQQTKGQERDRPAQQDQGHRHIHWVAAIAIEAHDNQFLWRCPWGKRALAGDIKVSDTPQQASRPENDQDESEGPMKREAGKPNPDAGHEERHGAGQGKKCNDGSRENESGP